MEEVKEWHKGKNLTAMSQLQGYEAEIFNGDWFYLQHSKIDYMYADTRKISLIEEVLKVDNEDTLKALETVLKRSRKNVSSPKNKPSIYDFVGILTKKEAETMRTAIDETCETINPDDWK